MIYIYQIHIKINKIYIKNINNIIFNHIEKSLRSISKSIYNS